MVKILTSKALPDGRPLVGFSQTEYVKAYQDFSTALKNVSSLIPTDEELVRNACTLRRMLEEVDDTYKFQVLEGVLASWTPGSKEKNLQVIENLNACKGKAVPEALAFKIFEMMISIASVCKSDPHLGDESSVEMLALLAPFVGKEHSKNCTKVAQLFHSMRKLAVSSNRILSKLEEVANPERSYAPAE